MALIFSARKDRRSKRPSFRSLSLSGLVAVVLTVPVDAEAVIHGEKGKLAFQATRAGGEDVWFADAPGGGDPRLMRDSSPTARDGRPAWAPPANFFVFLSDVPEGPVAPGSLVSFGVVSGRGVIGGIQVEWPDVPTPSVPEAISNGTVTVRVPTGAVTGTPCVTVTGSSAVHGWAGRVPFPREIVVEPSTEPPASAEDRDGCDQPLAFQSDRRNGRFDIWLSAGGQAEPLNATLDAPDSNETAPAWSAGLRTGTGSSSRRERPLLAFVSDRSGLTDIFVVDTTASSMSPVNVTRTPREAEFNPDWSPDGRWLTFEREQGGDRQLWVVGIDPATDAVGAARQVTAGLGPSVEPSWFKWTEGGSDVPEDSDQIAFNGPGEEHDQEIHYAEEIPSAPVPFSNPAAITQWTFPGALGNEIHPTWAPDGEWIVYASDRLDGPLDAERDFDLYAAGGPFNLVQPIDETEHQWTTGSGDDLHPAWQPLWLEASVVPRRPRGRASKRRKPRAVTSITPVVEPPGAAPVPDPRPEPGPRPACTQTGTPRADALRGTPGDNVICGGGGDDLLIGAGGDDRLVGGRGNDRLQGGPGEDRLIGDRGDDRLDGGTGSDDERGGAGADRMSGGRGEDRLRGSRGKDRLRARDGRADVLAGGGGLDRARADRGIDRISGVERVRLG